MQDVVEVFADDEHSLVRGLEGLFGELSHVRLQEGVEDVGEGFPSLLLQILLCCQTLLRLPLNHLSHLRDKNHTKTTIKRQEEFVEEVLQVC